jgi:type III pantothenate kinase
MGTYPEGGPDEIRALLSAFLAEAPPGARPSAAVMASVVPELEGPMVAALTALLGAPPLQIGPGVKTGMPIRTDDPREVGADRIAGAIAAQARFGSPVVVVDFGTSINVDCVDAEGAYAGTFIAPGMDVAADALARRTAGLRRVTLAAPRAAIATSTDEALRSGLVLGYAGLVDGLVAAAREAVGAAPVVATGTASWIPILLAACPSIETHDELLALRGLAMIYERTLKPRSPERR